MGEQSIAATFVVAYAIVFVVVLVMLFARMRALEDRAYFAERVISVLLRGFVAAHLTEKFDADMKEANALIDYGATDEAIEILERWKQP